MTDFAKLEIRIETKGVDNANLKVKSLDDGHKSATRSAKALGAAVGAIATSAVVQQVVSYSDAWQRSANQLRLVTGSTAELAQTQDDLLAVANQTRSSFDATAELYTKLARSTESLNLSNTELLQLTKDINNGFRITGGDAAAASGAIRQLGQALSAGALRGDEFNSIAEQAPVIMDALVESLNMTKGELREFAAEGGITSEILVKAMQDYSDVIDNQVASSVDTFGQKQTIAKNNLEAFVGTSESAATMVNALGDALVFASEHFDLFARSVGGATSRVNNFLGAVNPWSAWAKQMGVDLGSFTDQLGVLIEDLDRATTPIEQFHRELRAGGLSEVEREMGDVVRQLAALEKGHVAYVNSQGRAVRITDEWMDLLGELEDLMRIRADLAEEMAEATRQQTEAEEAAAAQSALTAADVSQLEAENRLLMDSYIDLESVISPTIERTVTYAKVTQDANKGLRSQINLVENTQREWANLINSVFVDGVGDVGDFFDVIAKGIARATAEIVAMKAAVGIFGGNGQISIGGGGGLGGAAGSIVGSLLGGNASSLLGAILPGGGNSMVAPATAAGGLFSGFASMLTNPWTLGLGALAIGSANDWWSNPDGYIRTNAGFLAAPTPGADPNRLFSVDPFASGFQPIGFASRQSQDAARSVIGQFGSIDSQITSLARQAGFNVDLSGATLGGFGGDGIGPGTFFGQGGMNELSVHLDEFARQIAKLIAVQNGVIDVSDNLSTAIEGLDLTTASADEVIAFLENAVQENTAATQENTDSQDQASRSSSSSIGGLGGSVFGPSLSRFFQSPGQGIGTGRRYQLPTFDTDPRELPGDPSWIASWAYRDFVAGQTAGGSGIFNPLDAQWRPRPAPGAGRTPFDSTPVDLSGFFIPSPILTGIPALGSLAFNDFGGAQSGLAVAQSAANLRDYQQLFDAGRAQPWTQSLLNDFQAVYDFNTRQNTDVSPNSPRGRFLTEQALIYDRIVLQGSEQAQLMRENNRLLQLLVDDNNRTSLQGSFAVAA